jgi:hypothetical protein
MYLKEMLLILFLSLLSSSLAFPFRVTKTHWRGSHILNSEDPDNNGDSCKSSPISGRLYEHIKDPDSSSLLENEVCDYGILTALAEVVLFVIVIHFNNLFYHLISPSLCPILHK